jgi:hypothetical protein
MGPLLISLSLTLSARCPHMSYTVVFLTVASFVLHQAPFLVSVVHKYCKLLDNNV